MRRDILVVVGASVASAAVASAATWFYADKVLSKKYEEKFDLELEESVKFLVEHQNITKMVVKNDPQESDTVDDLAPEVYKPEPLDEVPGERVVKSQEAKTPLEELVNRNQTTDYNAPSAPVDFTGGSGDEILPEEEPYEDPDVSVISRDIYEANPTEWPQFLLQYFSDKGVVDDQGDFVVDPETKIGQRTPPFGQMSDDANVVYLRNTKLREEYEVIYDPGKASDFFTKQDGDDDSLQHSLQELQRRYAPNRRR